MSGTSLLLAIDSTTLFPPSLSRVARARGEVGVDATTLFPPSLRGLPVHAVRVHGHVPNDDEANLIAQAAVPPSGGALPGPDSMFDVFVPPAAGAAGPSGVASPAVSGVVVDVLAPVVQTAGP